MTEHVRYQKLVMQFVCGITVAAIDAGCVVFSNATHNPNILIYPTIFTVIMVLLAALTGNLYLPQSSKSEGSTSPTIGGNSQNVEVGTYDKKVTRTRTLQL